MKKRNKIGLFFIHFGIFFIILGFFISVLYFLEYNRSDKNSIEIVSQIKNYDIKLEDSAIFKEGKDVEGNKEKVILPYFEKSLVIDKKEYIGYISFSTLDLELPILKNYNESDLNIAPMVYNYDKETNKIIIAGHNYKRHFSKLKYLNLGDSISIKSAENIQYDYEVVAIETIDGYDLKSLIEPYYDLSLFTCTIGGKSRLVIRCQEIKKVLNS